MKEEVRAMIDATVREWKEEWPKIKTQESHSQRRTQGLSTPSATADCARDDDANGGRAKAEAQGAAEAIDGSYRELKQQVKAELLVRIRAASAKFFEKLAVELMLRLGYGGSLQSHGLVTGRTGDEGIDGVIWEDRLGLDLVYIQAKRWTRDVSREEIQKFVGALHGKNARKGVFITTSWFRKSALEFAAGLDEKRVVLIDADELTELMFETGLGLVTEGRYEVKRIDPGYFAAGPNAHSYGG